jgi:hypothetical protein
MYKDPSESLFRILEIIGYKGDRNKFTTDFLTLCFQTTFLEFLKDLTPDEEMKLKIKIENVKTHDEYIALLKPYIDAERLQAMLVIKTSALFQEYITEIMPTLSPERKMKLLDYLASLSTISNKM